MPRNPDHPIHVKLTLVVSLLVLFGSALEETNQSWNLEPTFTPGRSIITITED
jgi:hypothetical protein